MSEADLVAYCNKCGWTGKYIDRGTAHPNCDYLASVVKPDLVGENEWECDKIRLTTKKEQQNADRRQL